MITKFVKGNKSDMKQMVIKDATMVREKRKIQLISLRKL
jgi:hypothetical protein